MLEPQSGFPSSTDLVSGYRPTKGLVIRQVCHGGGLSTHRAACLPWPQPDVAKSGLLGIQHQQLLPTGSCHTLSRKGLFPGTFHCAEGLRDAALLTVS